MGNETQPRSITASDVKLHLGCGKRYLPGFVHVDMGDWAHIDHRLNVRDLRTFHDNHASLIYASHVLEYFDRLEVTEVLAEWRRVLKPGGILRIAVPDFEALVSVYKDTRDLRTILGPLYGRISVGPGLIYHKTVYDFASLKSTLEDCGFSNVRRYDWRSVLPPDFDDHSQAYFPHMDKERGTLVSLNVEAVK